MHAAMINEETGELDDIARWKNSHLPFDAIRVKL